MSNANDAFKTGTTPLTVTVVGKATSAFLVISFLFCVALAFVSTRAEFHNAWFALLPGVAPLTPRSTLLGIAESFAYGWYVALVFVPLYNWANRWRAASA